MFFSCCNGICDTAYDDLIKHTIDGIVGIVACVTRVIRILGHFVYLSVGLPWSYFNIRCLLDIGSGAWYLYIDLICFCLVCLNVWGFVTTIN